jgi:hypothetical protein
MTPNTDAADITDALARMEPDALYEWLLRSVHEATDPLAHLTDAELLRVAEGGSPPTPYRQWLTPPLARLQLRLRAILAEGKTQ